MHRKRYLRHGTWAVVLCGILVFGAQSSRADDFYPGLPDPDGTTGSSWGGASQGGMSYAKRAKQWFRSPDGMVTFTAAIIDQGPGDGNSRSFGAFGEAFIVSPKGAPENYGYLPPMTVRSVGFGLIPVEATVQISQRRANGYPIPLSTTLTGTDYYDSASPGGVSRQESHPTVVKDAFNVELLGVRIDGVDLGLTGNCRTTTPAPFTMIGPAYTIPLPRRSLNFDREWYQSQDPSRFFHPNWGGQLSGTITIPPFTGCTTASGDDLSALMTLSVSGPDNPLTARVGWPCDREVTGVGWPLAPGEATPKLVPETWRPLGGEPGGCPGTKKIPYPERPGD